MSLTPGVARGQTGSASISAALDDAVRLDSFTVAQLALADNLPALHTGKMVHCSNGAAGSPCLAYSNGTAWLRVLLGLAVNIAS